MRKTLVLRFLLPVVCTIFIAGIHAAAQRKEIIGYYPAWKWRGGEKALTPVTVPYKKLTIINYAFFRPLPDGSLTGIDSAGDEVILNGRGPGGSAKEGASLTALAHSHGVKVMLSIGGWGDSDLFPAIAANETTRAAFAHSCIAQMRRYGFDGIDIDWEYPCYPGHKGTPGDKENFTKLLQATRDSLDAYGSPEGVHYLLTAALPAVPEKIDWYEIGKVADLLDMLNVMTYDFIGQWDSLSGHNAALYAPDATDSLRNADAAFRLLNGTYRISASKINIGVPFYGRIYGGCTAIGAHHTGNDTAHFRGATCDYREIVGILDKYSPRWDDRAKASYLVSTEWNSLITYDNAEAVRCKAQYVVGHGACGLIIWDITGDYLPDGSSPLLDVIDSVFSASPQK